MKVFQQFTAALLVLIAQVAFAEEESNQKSLRGKHVSVFEEIKNKPVVGLTDAEVNQRCSLLKELVFNSEPSLKITKGASLLSHCHSLFKPASEDHKVKLPVAKKSTESSKPQAVKDDHIVAITAAKTE